MAGVQDDDEDAITGINITPLVDIVLVLLIIFMMTASYIVTPAIKVDLPRAASAEETAQSQLALVITKQGDIYLNNKKVDEAALKEFIREKKDTLEDLEAIIAADGSVKHERVVGLIDLIKTEGITKFALNTQADFSDPASEEIDEATPEKAE
ncbi:MAG: biopolymer transporter ExbD [Myxococcota bacterium]|nr:biopolymer transporter ExbD [Myxococcota bacterium]